MLKADWRAGLAAVTESKKKKLDVAGSGEHPTRQALLGLCFMGNLDVRAPPDSARC